MIPLDDDPLIHSALLFSLLVAGMAATIAIITGLCGFRRKPSPDLSAPHLAEQSDCDIPPSNATETTLVPPQQATTSTALATDEVIKELPPPPGTRALNETYSCNNFMTKSVSTRKISSTLSVKYARSISVSKILEKKRSKAENSVWTKTIILGEKCKVPSHDYDDDDGGVIYNGKGNTVSAYHPKTPGTISISRTTIPDQDKEKGTTRNEEEDSLC